MNESSNNISSNKEEIRKDSNFLNENVPNNQNFFSETVKFLIIAALVVLPIRIFVAQPFIVSGESMIPTFHGGDYIIVDELSYRLSEPKRGEVIVFRFPEDPSKFFIKRIIGLPGETVRIVRGEVTIINKENPKGIKLEEDYIENKSVESLERTLSEKEYFVMGDNRPGSSDSRIWGPLPAKLISGRAFIRLLPVTKLDVFPGFSN